ncbi:MAG: trypsin-like peptidase domain-containing protein [Phycisphaerales bacterium]|nr:trypsin-like peptidase domain-containing protein [Phycisphaerales bacterium]
MRRFFTIGPALLVLLAAAAALAFGPWLFKRAQIARIAANVEQASATLDRAGVLESLNREVRAVTEAVMPGVVHIEVQRRPAPEATDDRSGPWGRLLSSGAGWFFDQAGHIITNAHVVDRAERVRVETYDGRVLDAAVVGFDAMTDVALLRVDPGPGVFPLRRATRRPVYVGDHVYAFGSPFGIKFSMSQGVVSGLGRSEAATFIGLRRGYTNFIQTDAAMNPGNSGGPLVDVAGRVVGMNTAIANNATQPESDQPVQGQSAGIGFATPLETIEAVVAQLLRGTIVLRGFMGVVLRDIESVRAAEPGPGEFQGRGVLVAEVPPGGPAARAGLRAGDIVTALDGQALANQDVLRSIVSLRKPGDRASLRIWRDGQTLDIDVRIGAAYNDASGRLIPVPGSEDLSEEQIRARILGRQ